MAFVQQADAILEVITPQQLLVETSFCVVMLAIIAAMLAVIAFTIGSIFHWVGLKVDTAKLVASIPIVVPVTALCSWEFVCMTKVWIEQVSGFRFGLAILLDRQILLLVPIAILVMYWISIGSSRLIRILVEPLMILRYPAVILTLMAVSYLLLIPSKDVQKNDRLAQAEGAAAGRLPNIILISLDSLSAEDAALCGNGLPIYMSNLRALALQSTCFTRYYAVSDLTIPTSISIETAVLPWTHWAIKRGPVSENVAPHSLANRLGDVGYQTHMISSTVGSSPRYHGTIGYEGVDLVAESSVIKFLNAIRFLPALTTFSSYLTNFTLMISGIDNLRFDIDENRYPPELVLEAGSKIIAKINSPFFLWMHTWPPHLPYLPPKSAKYKLLPPGEFDTLRNMPSNSRYENSTQPVVNRLRMRYRETIIDSDEKIGIFLETLRRNGQFDNSLIIVTADHGESFEHGFLGHGNNNLHEAIIRIPLLIKLPEQRVPRTVETPMSQIDLAPTLLDLVGAGAINGAEGRSFAPAMRGKLIASIPIFSMALARESRFRPISGGVYVIVDGPYKLIHYLAEKRTELFNLIVDPGELHDLEATNPEMVERLLRKLKKRIELAEDRRNQEFGRK